MNGNVTLGDAALDNITLNGQIASDPVFTNGIATTTLDFTATTPSVVIIPNVGGTTTMVGTDLSQTLTNKTLTSPAISGGTIDGISIGGTTAATIANVDNIRLDGNTVSSVSGNLAITATAIADIDGTGVTIDASSSTVDINAAAAINIGNNANAQPINIGTGAADRTITIGNGTGATSVNLNAGTNGVKVTAAEFNVSGNATIGNTAFLTVATSNSAPANKMGASSVVSTNVFSTVGLGVDGDIITNSNVYASGTLTFSDKRYKKEIAPIENAASNISKLEGVSYFWRADEFPDNNFSDEKQLGLIAQEVEKVFPELVIVLPNGYKTVNYQALVPVLIEAIKEQQKLIETLMADLSNEKTTKEDMKAALDKQMKLSEMQMSLMARLQMENMSMKSDIDLIKQQMGIKAPARTNE